MAEDASAHLEKGDEVGVLVAERAPLGDERRHEDVDEALVVEGGADGVGEGADRVVEDEEVLLLVLVEGVDEVRQNRPEERFEFWPGLLLERRERRTARLLHPLVVVEAHPQEALHRRDEILLLVFGCRVLLDRPARVPAYCPARDRADERLLVVERVDEEVHQDREMGLNAGDAACVVCEVSRRSKKLSARH